MITTLVAVLAFQPTEPSGPAVPTWHDSIESIVATHCGSCHHQAGPAPFTLKTYQDVASRAAFVEAVVREGVMPPWLPGESGLPLQAHRGLDPEEVEMISTWVQSGLPRGTPTETTPAESSVSTMPSPDLRLSMPESWAMPAEGGENWGRRERDKRTFVLPMNNAQWLKVKGLAYTTAAPRAVHAVTFLADPTGTGRYLDDREEGPGHYMTGDVRDMPSGAMGGTGIGARRLDLPEGYHWEVPPRSEAVMQVHYRPSGRTEALQETLDLWLTEDPDSRPLRTLLSIVWRVDIPAGETRRLHETWTLPVDVDLVGLTTRASGVVTQLNLNATLPGGASKMLLDILDYDPHWRQTWLLETPLNLPAGTEVNGSWVLANTESNSRNPFVPVDRYVTARRTGTVATLLHVAATDSEDDVALTLWHQDMLRSRQKNQPVGADETPRP